MKAYQMTRFTITLRGPGEASGYDRLTSLRQALRQASIDGWTEINDAGSWRGRIEYGVRFEILRQVSPGSTEAVEFVHKLARIGREVMPEQEAIQITVDPSPTIVYEA